MAEGGTTDSTVAVSGIVLVCVTAVTLLSAVPDVGIVSDARVADSVT